MNPLARQLDALARDVAEIRRRIANLPVRWAASGRGRQQAVLPVAVETDGGGGGDSDTQASWTYTVRDLAGAVLGDTLTPAMQRHPTGSTLAGSHGLAYYASDGALVLLWVDEVLDTEAC